MNSVASLLLNDSNITVTFSTDLLTALKNAFEEEEVDARELEGGEVSRTDSDLACDVIYALLQEAEIFKNQKQLENVFVGDAELHCFAIATQQQLQQAQPKQTAATWHLLPFHIILEILDYLEQNVVIFQRNGEQIEDIDESSVNGFTREMQLLGRFRSDEATRTPFFLFRSLCLSLQQYTFDEENDSVVIEQWIYRSVLRNVRYLSIDFSLRKFVPSFMSFASKKRMPHLRAVTSYPLRVGALTRNGTTLLQNPFINERIRSVFPFAMESGTIDFCEFLQMLPALRTLDASSCNSFATEEFETINQCAHLRKFALKFVESDARVFTMCKKLTSITVELAHTDASIAGRKAEKALQEALQHTSDRLKHLCILGLRYSITGMSVRLESMPKCPQLTHLKLGRGVRVQTLKGIGQNLPNLRSLSLDTIDVLNAQELLDVSSELEQLIIMNVLVSDETQTSPALLWHVLLELVRTRPLQSICLPIVFLDTLEVEDRESERKPVAWVRAAVELVQKASRLQELMICDSDTFLAQGDVKEHFIQLLNLLPRGKLKRLLIEETLAFGAFHVTAPAVRTKIFADVADAFGLEQFGYLRSEF